ncbi:MAG: fructose-6-phosphate aldolase [Chloroflexota bacterium]|nr:fructose-6-phosphate aldolase [Chloroflexota bacterium]MXW24081.1 fructose-6-phosphate aldolase [Chloroflexota bacterium]MXZ63105.1 fructose-6-phosphate aldolase [Chloroflexota bacterium]MYE32951.1 fructose-6-phosphate aldolase [Chloroflexota bacterium]
MRIFLDTANIDDIRRGAAMGVVDGVTTNPSLVAAEGVEYRDRVLEICDVVDGPISAETISETADELVEEGRRIASWHENVVVKVAMSEAGLAAISRLSAEGISTNCTLVFSANQALLAARAGATLISPFIGRIDDAGQDGMDVVRESVQIMETYHLPSQVLAASVRHTRHVTEAALAGSHIATLPPKVLFQLIHHPLTDVGIERFLADAAKYTPV